MNDEDVLANITNRGKSNMQEKTSHKAYYDEEMSEGGNENSWHAEEHHFFAGKSNGNLDMLSDIWEFGSNFHQHPSWFQN